MRLTAAPPPLLLRLPQALEATCAPYGSLTAAEHVGTHHAEPRAAPSQHRGASAEALFFPACRRRRELRTVTAELRMGRLYRVAVKERNLNYHILDISPIMGFLDCGNLIQVPCNGEPQGAPGADCLLGSTGGDAGPLVGSSARTAASSELSTRRAVASASQRTLWLKPSVPGTAQGYPIRQRRRSLAKARMGAGVKRAQWQEVQLQTTVGRELSRIPR